MVLKTQESTKIFRIFFSRVDDNLLFVIIFFLTMMGLVGRRLCTFDAVLRWHTN
jgi:hypothetical protein